MIRAGLLLLAALLACAAPALAQPVPLDAPSAVTTVTAAPTCTVTGYTVSSGTDTALKVWLNARDLTDADRVITSVVWDAAGVNEALAAGVSADGNGHRSAIYYKLSPTAGASKTITITFAGTVDDAQCGAATYSNVHQSSPIGDTDSVTAASGISASLTLTTTAANSLILDNFVADVSATVGTNRQIRFSGATAGLMRGSEWAVTASGANFAAGWTFADSAHTFVALELKAASQPPGTIAITSAEIVANANDGGSTITLTVNPTGSNRFGLVGVSIVDASGTDRVVATVASDGTGTPSATKVNAQENGTTRVELWYFVALPEESQTITVTMGGACSFLRAFFIPMTGVHQSDPLDGNSTGATNSGTGTTASVALASNTANAYFIALARANAAIQSGAGQVPRWAATGNFGNSASRYSVSAATMTSTWGIPSSLAWAAVGVTVREAGAGGAAPTIPKRNPVVTALANGIFLEGMQ